MSVILRIAVNTFIIFSTLLTAFSKDSTNIITQTVKGRIVCFETRQPIAGATVFIAGTKLGTYSDKEGSFKIINVPLGRQILTVRAVGHETFTVNLVITSGKEQQLEIFLKESFIKADTIKVIADKEGFNPINENAIISSTIFTIDDVRRFAGSRMDVGRMAQNYAGVLGADDRRNDIIVRGGSPTEVLWRIDGLDVPNPNHFATQGATGGPISALNANLLDNSDFLTGAFPAEYGDKMSAVFDIHTRKGNRDRYEYLGQFGMNGFEIGAEGPLQSDNSSFIANYRYSFLDILDKLGVDFGFAGIPRYQDGMLKLDIMTDRDNQISVTGVFGVSNIDIKESRTDSVNTGDFDIRNGTDFVAIGINWLHLFSAKMYGRLTTGYVFGRYRIELDSITTDGKYNVLGLDRWFDSKSSESYINAKYSLNYSPGNGHFLTGGVELRLPFYNLNEQKYTSREESHGIWQLSENGNSFRTLSYINWNCRLMENLTINAGLMNQYFELNGKLTLESRLALSWQPAEYHSVNLGFGVHRQSLPLMLYFFENENRQLDFMQSIHYIAGYSWQLAGDALAKLEVYYKDISKAPVEKNVQSSYSFLNSGANFGTLGGRDIALKSDGVGRAYGVELSFTKHFSDNWYVLFTGSYVRQQYKGSDGILRFGTFDNRFIANILAGYEFVFSPSFNMDLSAKYTTAGGSPYTPIDMEKSKKFSGTYYIDSLAFTLRNPVYAKCDVRLDFRNNFSGWSLVSFIAVENIFNTNNVWQRVYKPSTNTEAVASQIGLFFYGGFRVEF